MGTPKVSIIVPVYNSELYLDRCIASALGQTYESFELILVDDGSNDSSMDICKKAQANDNRVKIIDCGKHSGVSYARNQGLDSAEGEYICFLDSDDCLHPQMLEMTVKQIELSGSDMCMTGRVTPDEMRKNFDEYCHSKLYPEWVICNGDDVWEQWFQHKPKNPVWAKLYRKDLIKDLRFNEALDIAEDTIFNYQFLASQNRKVSFTQIPLYYHYPREGSIMRTLTLDDLKRWIQIFDRLQENEINRGYRKNAIRLQCENIYSIRNWLIDTKPDRETQLMAKKILIAEKEHEWFQDIPLSYKFRVTFTCTFLPINNLLIQMKRMINNCRYQYANQRYKA